jgi:hypothetical protein
MFISTGSRSTPWFEYLYQISIPGMFCGEWPGPAVKKKLKMRFLGDIAVPGCSGDMGPNAQV